MRVFPTMIKVPIFIIFLLIHHASGPTKRKKYFWASFRILSLLYQMYLRVNTLNILYRRY